jgi:hypothetical protein
VDSKGVTLAALLIKAFIVSKLRADDQSTDNPFFSTVLAFGLLQISRPLLAIPVPNLLFLCGLSSAGVAQLVEHLICNQRVGGSIPSASSTIFR